MHEAQQAGLRLAVGPGAVLERPPEGEGRRAEGRRHAQRQGGKARVGITDYAQQKLGDITYVEPPQVGKAVKQAEFLCGIESVKAASANERPTSKRISALASSRPLPPS